MTGKEIYLGDAVYASDDQRLLRGEGEQSLRQRRSGLLGRHWRLAMVVKFNFRTGDTPARLIGDTIGLLLIVGLCWLGWMVTS